jgi:hypothetical protein
MAETTKRKPGRPRKEPQVTEAQDIASQQRPPMSRPAMYESGERPTCCMKCKSGQSRVLNTWIAGGMRFRRRLCEQCGQHWISRVPAA